MSRKKKDNLKVKSEKTSRKEEVKSDRIDIFDLFLNRGFTPRETLQIITYIEDMASTNTTARLESKIDAQNVKYNLLVIMLGIMMTAFLAVAGWLIASGGGGG